MINEKYVSRLFWGIRALLVAVLLYVAVKAVVTPACLGTAAKPRAVSGHERIAEVPQAEPGARPPADISVILENNLFAGASAPAGPQAGPQDQDSASSMTPAGEDLGLKLLGAIAGGPAASRAVIQNTTTNTTRPYKIGDMVASATVESIRPDTVVLRHQGERKVLRLHVGMTATNKSGSRTNEAAANTEQGYPAGRVMPPPSAKLGYVEDILRKATVEPHVENGQTRGLKITGLENTSLAGMFGLRNGDVVQTVNGQQLTTKQKAFQVLQKARTQSQIRIQLLRNGKAKDLSFDL